MIREVDPRLPPEVLFLLWAMGHGAEVAVVDSRYAVDRDGAAEVHEMGDADIVQAVRAVLTAVQLDTTFVVDPVRQIEHSGPEPGCAVRRVVQDAVDDALGFGCPITGIAVPDFREQVKDCWGLIITGEARKQGNFILRKGLDVVPENVLPVGVPCGR